MPTAPLVPPNFTTGSNSTTFYHKHFTDLSLTKTHPLLFTASWSSRVRFMKLYIKTCFQSPFLLPYIPAYLLVVFLSNMRTNAIINLSTDITWHLSWCFDTENELNKCLLSELMLKWLNCPIYAVSTDYRNHFTLSLLDSTFIKYLLCAKNYVRCQGDEDDNTVLCTQASPGESMEMIIWPELSERSKQAALDTWRRKN